MKRKMSEQTIIEAQKASGYRAFVSLYCWAGLFALALTLFSCGDAGRGGDGPEEGEPLAPLAEVERVDYAALQIPGLLAYLPCDGNARDFGPNGLDGIVDGSGLVNDRFGYRRGAYYFDGVNDSIGMPEAILQPQDAFSVSLWFMSEEAVAGALVFEGSLTETAFFLRYNPGQNRIVAKVDGGFNAKFDIPKELLLNDGRWHHIVFTANRSSGLTLVVDRVPVGEFQPDIWVEWADGPLQIGRLGQPTAGNASMLLTGRLDDIAFYGRVLSEEDVSLLFKDGPNRAPAADAGIDQSVWSNSVSFDGSGSGDVDGEIVRYDWDFGDGNSGTGAQPTHEYTEPGTYTVTLTVTDDEGETAVDTVSVRVNEQGIPDDTWPSAWAALEEGVVGEVNKVRASGTYCANDWYPPVGPLEMDNVIRIASRLHSQDMGEQNYFAHDSLDGRDFGDRMSEAGFTGASPWGENIATGYNTAKAVVEGWVSSPGHCRNLMEPAYKVMGIGYYYTSGTSTKSYWTQNFAASH